MRFALHLPPRCQVPPQPPSSKWLPDASQMFPRYLSDVSSMIPPLHDSSCMSPSTEFFMIVCCSSSPASSFFVFFRFPMPMQHQPSPKIRFAQSTDSRKRICRTQAFVDRMQHLLGTESPYISQMIIVYDHDM